MTAGPSRMPSNKPQVRFASPLLLSYPLNLIPPSHHISSSLFLLSFTSLRPHFPSSPFPLPSLTQTPTGKDPVSGEPLQIEDVITIKPGKDAGPVAPRPPSASSIPGMCVLFQNEWDALMLETFELKKQLDQVGLGPWRIRI